MGGLTKYKSVMEGYDGQPRWQPEYDREPPLEAPMISPDDLIGSGLGKLLMAALSPLWLMALKGGSKTGANAASRGQMGSVGRQKTQYELAHEEAQRNAALPLDKGGLGLPPNNTAADRAKAMGFDTEFQHGSPDDIKAFELAKTQRSDPGYLGQGVYGGPVGMKAYADVAAYPLVTKSKDLYKHTPQNWNAPDNPYSAVADRFGKDWGNRNQAARDYTSEQLKKGVKGVIDTSSGNLDQIAIYDPSIIRSKFAAFDPFKKDRADLLAGLAAAGIPATVIQQMLADSEKSD